MCVDITSLYPPHRVLGMVQHSINAINGAGLGSDAGSAQYLQQPPGFALLFLLVRTQIVSCLRKTTGPGGFGCHFAVAHLQRGVDHSARPCESSQQPHCQQQRISYFNAAHCAPTRGRSTETMSFHPPMVQLTGLCVAVFAGSFNTPTETPCVWRRSSR